MAIKYPQGLDGNEELYLTENEEGTIEEAEPTDIMAEHHNALKDAVMAIESKLGIDDSGIENSIDYLVKQRKISSQPPDGFVKVENIYLKEIDQEVILIT